MPYKKRGRFYYRHGKRYTLRQIRAIHAWKRRNR